MTRARLMHRVAALSVSLIYICEVGSLHSEPNVRAATDHLIPSTQQIDTAYAALLAQRLFLTPANYARIVVLPSSAAGEVAIAIYSLTEGNREKQVFLTCTRAARNLWYSVSESNPKRTEEAPIKVKRIDVPFSPAAAAALSLALNEMLKRTRALDRENRIILDGTAIQFSVEADTQHAMTGLLTPYAKGEHSEALRRLTNLLTDYCDAQPEKRTDLAKDIEHEATRLVQMLR